MIQATQTKKPYVLIVLDGWGYREDPTDNAIAAANTPCWDQLWQTCPHTLISGSGHDVGLPDDQMGNSEVGHITLGAGRVVYQDLTRIDHAIETGEFFKNSVLVNAAQQAKNNSGRLHIFGLASSGGVHSHQQHLLAMIDLAAQQGVEKIILHVFLDGRDCPPKSAEPSLQLLNAHLKKSGRGVLASITGRYYAMDRDQRWDRIEKAYQLLTENICDYHYPDPISALQAAYARGENDEFVQPTLIDTGENNSVRDGDVVVFMNFRSDRARQLTRCFIDKEFSGFARKKIPQLATFVTCTQYDANFNVPIAFPPQSLKQSLGDYLAQLGKTQLRIAETEKYAHVTFFFNGGNEQPYAGENRILVNSPKVATYDLQPEMSAPEVTDKLVSAILSGQYDFILCNYANGDMVGHTGIFSAAVKAAETIDHCLTKVIAAIRQMQGECLITADHGNLEQMCDHKTHQPHTAHTCEPVPLVYVGENKQLTFSSQGTLADVAPTLLQLMNLEIPREMTGRVLWGN